jgi:hypothetical protein
MSSAEFAEWIAFHNIDPWSEHRADIRSATIATVIANANRGKRSKPFKVDDFMPKFEPRKRTVTDPKQFRAAMAFFCQSTGGRVSNG